MADYNAFIRKMKDIYSDPSEKADNKKDDKHENKMQMSKDPKDTTDRRGQK